jgi:3-phosphoshikimate 1-carboxyvinyltransferase
VQADLSSQYLSAILMVAPSAQQPISLEAAGEMVSETYVELTIEGDGRPLVSQLIAQIDDDSIFPAVLPGATLRHRRRCDIGRLLRPRRADRGSRHGENIQPLASGDMELLLILERGRRSRDSKVTVQDQASESSGVVDMTAPDGVMTLAVLAALAQGETRIVNVANLRIKESNRRRHCGRTAPDGHRGGELPMASAFRGTTPCRRHETYADHRMAMSFAILEPVCPASHQYPRVRVEKLSDVF